MRRRWSSSKADDIDKLSLACSSNDRSNIASYMLLISVQFPATCGSSLHNFQPHAAHFCIISSYMWLISAQFPATCRSSIHNFQLHAAHLCTISSYMRLIYTQFPATCGSSLHNFQPHAAHLCPIVLLVSERLCIQPLVALSIDDGTTTPPCSDAYVTLEKGCQRHSRPITVDTILEANTSVVTVHTTKATLSPDRCQVDA